MNHSPRFGRRRRALALIVAVLAVSVVGAGQPAASGDEPQRQVGPPDTYVVNWDAVGTQAFSAAGLTPAEGFMIFGYVAVAVYDAVVAVEGGFEPFAVDLDAPGVSAEAAVAAAAHRVLAHYLPAQKASILDPALAASLLPIPDDQDETEGIAIGEAAADAFIAQRAGDGYRASVTYTPPNPPIPGVWLPTATTPPIGTYSGRMRPFAIDSADQFRPDGPPALDGRQWAEEYDEVRAIGSASSTTRTPEQTLAARFWAEAPVQQTRGSFRRFVTDHDLDIVDAARFMAMASVVYADALISCFEAKYHYTFWRPVTAIRAGDTDGNTATVADPTWSPLIGVPNHPEYPSGHSCITPTGGRVAARFLGTGQIDFTVPSLTGLGDRTFAQVRDLEYEGGNARIWGGIHFRSAVEDGRIIARKVTNQVLAHHFRPTES